LAQNFESEVSPASVEACADARRSESVCRFACWLAADALWSARDSYGLWRDAPGL